MKKFFRFKILVILRKFIQKLILDFQNLFSNFKTFNKYKRILIFVMQLISQFKLLCAILPVLPQSDAAYRSRSQVLCLLPPHLTALSTSPPLHALPPGGKLAFIYRGQARGIWALLTYNCITLKFIIVGALNYKNIKGKIFYYISLIDNLISCIVGII